NKDYEPFAIQRDEAICQILETNKSISYSFKDQVLFEEKEITKADGLPYTVYTPYKNKWLEKYHQNLPILEFDSSELFSNFYKSQFVFPSLEQIGFVASNKKVKPYTFDFLTNYQDTRDFPAIDSTSYLSPHL